MKKTLKLSIVVPFYIIFYFLANSHAQLMLISPCLKLTKTCRVTVFHTGYVL